MTRVNKFCGSCSPQMGISTLLWTILIICSFAIIVDVYQIMGTFHEPPNDYSWDSLKSVAILFYKISVLMISIIGIYGISKNKPQLLVIFYYFNYIQLFLISVLIFYLFFDPISFHRNMLPKNIQFEDHSRVTVLTFLLLFGLAFQIYFTLVVKSYYETMKDRCSSRSHILIFAYPEYYNYGFV